MQTAEAKQREGDKEHVVLASESNLSAIELSSSTVKLSTIVVKSCSGTIESSVAAIKLE